MKLNKTVLINLINYPKHFNMKNKNKSKLILNLCVFCSKTEFGLCSIKVVLVKFLINKVLFY